MFNKVKLYVLRQYYILQYKKRKKLYNNINVEKQSVTIDKLKNERKSLSRYGDGEFSLIFGQDLKFQKYDEKLAKKLKDNLISANNDCLIGIPDIFRKKSIKKYVFNSQMFWLCVVNSERRDILNLLKSTKIYHDSLISRPYIIYKRKNDVKMKFEEIISIWDNKNIVIIEGLYSRLGVGNDLLDNTKSIKRILCPAENAFEKYDEIIKEVKKIDKDIMLILALGPTATVLAYDLAELGYQAIDIGHIDIEYEWHLKGSTSKEKIEGKYTNEAKKNENSELMNNKYENEVIAIIDEVK